MASPSKGKGKMFVDTGEKVGEPVPGSSEDEVQSPYRKQIKVSTRVDSGGEFHYCEDRVIKGFVKFVLLDDMPLDYGERDSFITFVQTALNPEFKGVPTSEVLRTIKDAYIKYKKALQKYFGKFDGLVVISCDVWSIACGERDGYVCIICHWIDEAWKMQKRIIGFEFFSDEFMDEKMQTKIASLLHVFKLKQKVFAFSFDDASTKEKCMEYLSNNDDFKPLMLDLSSHCRTCVYTVNLCAQQAVDQLALLINPIRELVKWIRLAIYRRDEFKALCKDVGLKPRHFCLDFIGNWSSTYDFLCHTYRYRDVLTKLYNDNVSERSIAGSQWDAINSIINLLEKFSSANHTFSLIYDASCHLVIHECINIVHTLKVYENDPLLCSVVRDMKNKWLEYFSDFPTVYCIATMLDPRIKVEGLHQLLVYYYETLGVNCCVDEKIVNCKNILNQLHAHYASKYKRETKIRKAPCSKKAKEKHHSSSSFDLVMNIVKRERVDGDGKSAGLDEYLHFQHGLTDDSFDILQWWKEREELFPILSKIAKNVLSIPVSTVAPKSASESGKRVLDEKRSMYDPNLLRACICQKDWYMAEIGTQGLQYSDDEVDPWISSDSETDD